MACTRFAAGEPIRVACCSGGSPLKWRRNPVGPGSPSILPRRLQCWCVCATVFLASPVVVSTQQGPQSQQSTQSQQSAPQPANGNATAPDPGPGSSSIASPPAVPTSQNGVQDSEAIDAEQKQQIADESAKLLKLAADLKAEVDKTTKDTLSINVIRKADEIEKLAHSVKENMKPTAGTN
jgi:hypothetical protein